MKKRFALLALLLVTVLLTGCLAPKVNFTIKPDPIELTFEKTKVDEITLEVRLSGVGFNYEVKEALIELFEGEPKGEPVYYTSKTINKRIPVMVPGYKEKITVKDISLEPFFEQVNPELSELVYETKLKNKPHTLKITLTGKNPTSNTAKVKFE